MSDDTIVHFPRRAPPPVPAVAPNALEQIFAEIEATVNAGLFYAALSITVSIPDICCTLEGKAPVNWETYKAWFRENVRRYQNFGADECWEMRCGVVHNARLMGGKDKRSDFDRILFTPPGSPFQLHDSVTEMHGERILYMAAVPFCHEIVADARAWAARNAANDAVLANLPNVVRLRPNGYGQHIVGAPVIG
ncbi:MULTISPECIES: hypothetical protein [unclassified Brevundimonas]